MQRKQLEQTITAKQARSARVWLGWTQADVGTAAGIATRTVAEFELERRVLRETTARKFVDAFERAGVRFAWDERNRGIGFTALPEDVPPPESSGET